MISGLELSLLTPREVSLSGKSAHGLETTFAGSQVANISRLARLGLGGPDLGTGWGLFTEGPVLRGNWKKVSEHFGINHKSFGSFLKVSGSFHEYSMKIKTCVFAVFDFHGIFMEVSGSFREASGRHAVLFLSF